MMRRRSVGSWSSRRVADDRCARISRFNRDKVKELEAGIRFHGAGDTIAMKNERELARLTSSGIRDSYTTTELAKLLGVTTQTIRNLKDRIPGAKTVGQRLRFEKTEELRRYLDPKRRERVKVVSWSKPRKSSWYDIEQPMLKGILPSRAR
jgi:excisionase family DNA binding protein